MQLKWFFLAICLTLSGPSWGTSQGASPELPWQRVLDEQGITVDTAVTEDSDLITVRGRTLFKRHVGKVMALMLQHKLRALWVDSLESIKRIKLIDGRRDAVSYYQVNMPWPVTDRDFVVRTTVSYDAQKGVVLAHSRSVEDLRAEDPDYVRAQTHLSTVTLVPKPDDQTAIEIIARVDPKGSLPTWLVNYLQRRWAFNTLRTLGDLLIERQFEIDPMYYQLTGHKPPS